MPLLRPPTATAIFLRSTSTVATTPITVTTRTMASSHGSHYDPPTGWFLNTPPGETPKKEGWEGVMYWGFFGSLAIAAVAYAYKPDTSIQTWALEEARRRLETEGVIADSTKVKVTDALKTVSEK